MSKRIVAGVLILLAIAPHAQAVTFASLDTNRDGVVTYQEAKRSYNGLSEVIFLKADTNGDGVIEPSEFPGLDSLYQTVYRSR